MRSNLTKGIICIKDNYNIEYQVSIIEYEEFEDETYEYRFYPNYEIIGLLNDDIFQGIPGLNLDLRKKKLIMRMSSMNRQKSSMNKRITTKKKLK